MQLPASEYYREFLSWDIERQHRELIDRPAGHWQETGGEKALETFHQAAARVPAYGHFLREHGVDARSVQTLSDFSQVPVITKKNYLRQYPLHELCWDGSLAAMNVISVSSGSTGRPFMWPRDAIQEREVDHYYHLTYEYMFRCSDRPTLVLICFALGMYIAGPFTYASSLRYGQKGKPMAITCPSNNIDAALRIIEELAPEYEQIVIGGYPPLIKDLLDCAAEKGLLPKDKPIRLFFGGESFTEHWRDHVHGMTGAQEILSSAINMYGTADAALLGIETPTSIAFRRLASANTDFRSANFLDERLPSVLTYNPLLKYFECENDGSLLFTSSSGLPVIRYEIGDHGGLISYGHAELAMREAGSALDDQLRQHNVSHLDWKLPLVYLFGRKDFTVHLYGANVYPENIKEALEDSHISDRLTGKFIMTVEQREDLTPYLSIRVQLAAHTVASSALRQEVRDIITRTLKRNNSEYSVIYSTIQDRALPEIQLDAHSHQDYLIDIKHRWTKHS